MIPVSHKKKKTNKQTRNYLFMHKLQQLVFFPQALYWCILESGVELIV